MLIVLLYPNSGVLGIPTVVTEYIHPFMLATEKALPPKSKLTESLPPELDPPRLTLFAELEAIVTLPETVTSTPPTDTAKLGAAKSIELAAIESTVKIRSVFFMLDSISISRR